VIFHAYYADVPGAQVEAFVDTQELGRVVSVGGDGMPHVGLYPFVRTERTVDLHMVRQDEIAVDLRARPRCLFEVDEPLGVIPSYWVHAEYGGSATAYHRTVIFECTASVVDDPRAVAAQQQRLMARYQPEGGFRPIDPDDALYRGALAQLAAVQLTVERVRTKFKLGQNRPAETRRKVVQFLRERGRPNDARAAEALESTLS
jgi:predicted FMN-binding regulatory protein PaiB